MPKPPTELPDHQVTPNPLCVNLIPYTGSVS